MKRFILSAFFALGLTAAHAQSVMQSGSVTPNTVAVWNSTGIIKGGALATDSPVTNFGVTREGSDGICVASARQSAVGRNTLCLSASTTASAKITLQNYGTATAQNLDFVINGTTVTLPTGGSNFVTASGALVSGHFPKWSGTSGLVIDSGVGAGAATQYGVAYYSATDTITSTAAGTNGQMVVGQTAAAPLWKTLTGDVSTVSSAGAVTLGSVNGVTHSSTYTAHGVLIGEGTSAYASVATGTVGLCLLSQGSGSDPTWSTCSSGTGSAAGSNTQVQFNNSTALGGSANLTWVSPALTIGVAATTTGQLALANGGGAGASVTLQNNTATTGYNFNFPASAGTSGQPLISQGGGSNPMTFATLGIAGGGTSCAAASGTCLDNITGFSSTGFLNRTGAGAYAFTVTIGLANGGTGNILTASNGGIVYSDASGLQILAGTATANRHLASGASSAPAWTTATFPATTTINQILYSSSANTVAGLATANGSVVNTSSSGVPSLTPTPVLGVAGTTVGSLGFQNATSGTITLSPVAGALGSVTITMPAATDTMAVLAASQAFTNKTYNGLTVSSSTGTLTISNGKTLTSTGTLTFAGTDGKTLTISNSLTLAGTDNKTLTVSNSLTLAGTDSTTMTFPSVSATIPRTVASGAKALATGAISSAACTTAQTDTATGTLTTDAISASFNGDPTGVTGYVPLTTGMLTIMVYPTADTVNFKVCNNTSSSITPGAITINWRVIR